MITRTQIVASHNIDHARVTLAAEPWHVTPANQPRQRPSDDLRPTVTARIGPPRLARASHVVFDPVPCETDYAERMAASEKPVEKRNYPKRVSGTPARPITPEVEAIIRAKGPMTRRQVIDGLCATEGGVDRAITALNGKIRHCGRVRTGPCSYAALWEWVE